MKNILFSILTCITVSISVAQNVGIGVAVANNKLEVASTVISQLNSTILGTNNGNVGSGVSGNSESAGTRAVQGTSENGIGVYGFSSNNIGVNAYAINGRGLLAVSFGGLGLSVSGKLQLSGGDTNPSDGAVLTSDASGNAVWKAKKVGFSAHSAANTSVPISTFRKVEFSSESYDHQNNFVHYPGATSSATSVFTAPVAGIYHFSTSVLFENLKDIASGQIRLVKNSSGNVLANYEGHGEFIGYDYYWASLVIEGDFYLNVNDKVWVEVAQRNIFSSPIGLNGNPAYGRFSGYIRMAD